MQNYYNIIYFHGGAYSGGLNKVHWNFIERISEDTHANIFVPDYPLIPKSTYEDVFNMADTIYEECLKENKFIIIGDSAGGGISLAFSQKLGEENKQMPEKIVLISPWLDITMKNEDIDYVQESDKNKIVELLDTKEISEDLLNNIKCKIEYEYKNKLATTIPTKSSVTKLKQMKEMQIGVDIEELSRVEETEITFHKPKFLEEEKDEKITSAQKGTLIHLCMQKLNPKEQYDLQKIQDLINDLEQKQIITEKEADAINVYKILEFTKSNIWEQLKTAKEIYQEKPFYINVPAKTIYEQEIDENVLVQGIIDLYYIDKDNNLILLDYKTDYVEKGKEYELIEKYKTQLELYKQALEQALHKKVDKTYIYSVYLGKEIEL